jgi:Tol biopolymer transport system component
VAHPLALYGEEAWAPIEKWTAHPPILEEPTPIVEYSSSRGRRRGSPKPHFNPRISPDGTHIAFDQYDTGTQTTQVWVGDITRGVQTRLTSGSGSNAGAVWSPDGSRIAFQSDRKHQADVFVRAAAATGADEAITDEDRQRIPIANAKWSRGGREIVYSAFDGKVTSVEIDASHGLRVGTPKPLFQLPEGTGFDWDVSADGERFLLNVPVIKSSSIPLSLVLNWTAGLRK